MSSSTAPSMESTATQALKRKSGDIGWDYARLVDPKKLDRVQCTLCNKIMGGGISRLKQHVAGIMGSVKACDKSTNDQKMRVLKALKEFKMKKKSKQDDDEALRGEVNIGGKETINLDDLEESFGELKSPRSFGPIDRFTSFEDKGKGKGKEVDVDNNIRKGRVIEVKEYICRWAYECALPFHAFEKDSFKKLLEAVGQFGPRALPPNRYEMGDTYLKKEVKRTKDLLKRYEEEWDLNGCSIMTDAWSDMKRRSIMNLCVNSKLGTVFLSSKESSDVAHTSQYIFEYVDSCIEEVGPDKVVQVVTDNASNNMGAATLLKEKRPNIFWTSCATHTMNLMLEGIGGLKKYKEILDEAKKLTVFIYAHHKTLALMRHFTKKRDIVRPGVTRFASAFLTLQSLLEKKFELRHMFGSTDWENCKFSKTQKGKHVFALVVHDKFWAGVTLCLKIFAPLVKVLRMVDADWKPSMGFIYGELEKAKEEIKVALNNNERAYGPIMDIILLKSSNRLDTSLHKTAYLLNPFYLYNNPSLKKDLQLADSISDVVETLYPENYEIQNLINLVEWPLYKSGQGKFDRIVAMKGCEVNDENFDPANWWGIYGGSTPHLRKMAMRILSLTTSSSGCERNWSTFEGIHTKKRNRLETTKMNNLVYVKFNANLMEKNKRRRAREREVLLAEEDASEAQDWLVEGDVEGNGDEFAPGLTWGVVGDAMGVDEVLRRRTSDRINPRARELFDEEFESESEEEVNEDVEYDSDGVEIIEQYGQGGNLASI